MLPRFGNIAYLDRGLDRKILDTLSIMAIDNVCESFNGIQELPWQVWLK
jgi:hypothetical protein